MVMLEWRQNDTTEWVVCGPILRHDENKTECNWRVLAMSTYRTQSRWDATRRYYETVKLRDETLLKTNERPVVKETCFIVALFYLVSLLKSNHQIEWYWKWRYDGIDGGGGSGSGGVYDTRQQNETLPHCNQSNVSITKWWQEWVWCRSTWQWIGSNRIESNQVNGCARVRRADKRASESVSIVKIIGKASLTTS